MPWKLMRKMSKNKLVTLSISLVLIILSFITVAESLSPEPPLFELNQARVQLEICRKEKSDIYAPELYQEALKNWDSVQQAWKMENNKWSFRRNFQPIIALAKLTEEEAELARIRSLKVQDSLHIIVHLKIPQVRMLITNYLDEYEMVTTRSSIKNLITQSEQALQKSEIASRTRDYYGALDYLNEAEANVQRAHREMTEFISSYFSHIPEWERWVNESIRESEENQTAVLIINKMDHWLSVYRSGVFIAQFDIEMGANWLGPKQYRGDKATPEGHYVIVKKREKPKTIYHKALELNYPNAIDEKNFSENLASGRIPPNAEIGGSIEIHGEGGTGTNWTDGCIALKNSDMDSLFQMVEEGTPVTIIGTLERKIPRARR